MVLQLSELPAGVSYNQLVCAATMVVPHTCRGLSPAPALEEVRTPLGFPCASASMSVLLGPTYDVIDGIVIRSQPSEAVALADHTPSLAAAPVHAATPLAVTPVASVSVLPCSTVQLPMQVEDTTSTLPSFAEETTSTTTIPSSASALIPSAKKGMTGPQMASLLQVKFDTGGKRCAHAQPCHARHSPHTTSSVHCAAHTQPSLYSRASAGSCTQHTLCHRL